MDRLRNDTEARRLREGLGAFFKVFPHGAGVDWLADFFQVPATAITQAAPSVGAEPCRQGSQWRFQKTASA